MASLIRLLLRLLLRVRVLGDLAPFGHADRLLIVANHHSRIDALVLALFLPRNPVVIVPPEEAGTLPQSLGAGPYRATRFSISTIL